MITGSGKNKPSPLEALLGHPVTPQWVEREVLSFKTWLAGLHYSPHTVRGYAADLREFLLSGQEPGEFLAGVRAGPHTVHRKAAAIRAWARWRGLNLFVPKVRVPKGLPKALTEEEVRRVEEAARLHPDPRVYPAVLLMSRMGLRRSEVCALRLRDIDLGARAVHVRNGKGQKDRTVPIAKGVLKPLEAMVKLYKYRKLSPDTPLFGFSPETLYRRVKELGEKVGLPDLHPHALRHTAATRMARKGVPTPHLAKIMGHRDLNTTQRYLKITVEDLKRVMEERGI